MRPASRRPEDSEFVPAREYETFAPASFGLPELPVLYGYAELDDCAAWIASNGVILWFGTSGTVYELDEVTIGTASIACPDRTIKASPELAQRLQSALDRCRRMFVAASTDSVELAVPVDYETGDADDLGDSRLIQSLGEGTTVTEGPIVAYKRRRSS